MRRFVLLSLFALAASDAGAQHRAGVAAGFGRAGFRVNRARAAVPYGSGYAYLPYEYGGSSYAYARQPIIFVQPPPPPVVEPPPPEVHPVVTNYTWPVPADSAATTEDETKVFGIVLKDGTQLSAVTVAVNGDALQVVEQDDRHLRISMSNVDRAATLKLNSERKLNLHLPASE